MNTAELNSLPRQTAFDTFHQCCAAKRWVEMMVDAMPYADVAAVLDSASRHWLAMEKTDYLEAFDGHPRIGDPDSLKEKYRNTHALASGEQSRVGEAGEQVLDQLVDYNQRYFDKFGYIFIVCATGKSAEQMLELLKSRLGNAPDRELGVAAAEQAKITAIRLGNLLTNN